VRVVGVVQKTSGVRRVALTGNIGTGKSHVRARLDRLQIPTIDADVLAREVVAPNTRGLAAVINRFGPGVQAPDGSLDRRALAAIVFGDSHARSDLEAIIHPAVRQAIDQWFASLDPVRHPFAVADIPLLFETGRDDEFDAVILTVCSRATQLKRLLDRGMTASEANQRIAAQMPAVDKLPRATFVIDTDGKFEATDRQVGEIVQELGGRR
jgi:dephospho-CoA kinase